MDKQLTKRVSERVLKERAHNKRSYAKHKDKRKAEVAAWRAANPDKVREYHKRNWERHGERVKRERTDKRLAAYAADPKGAWLIDTFRAAQTRARKRGLPFDARVPALDMPDCCPVLGLTLVYHARRGIHGPDSPSLDRVHPELGYVAGNLRVISNRANTLKNNATVDELRLVLADMEKR